MDILELKNYFDTKVDLIKENIDDKIDEIKECQTRTDNKFEDIRRQINTMEVSITKSITALETQAAIKGRNSGLIYGGAISLVVGILIVIATIKINDYAAASQEMKQREFFLNLSQKAIDGTLGNRGVKESPKVKPTK